MTAAPYVGAIVRIERIDHVGVVTAVDRPCREAVVSGHPRAVPWTALEYC